MPPGAAQNDYARRALAAYWRRCARARESFPDFAELAMKDHLGLPVKMARHHLAWIWHITYCWNRRLNAAIWAPWGHGKSVITSGLLTWLIGRNPQLRIKVVANGDPFAGSRVEAAKALMETPEYRDIFPGVKPGRKWNNREAFVDRKGGGHDPTLHARGVETKGIGGRADVIMFDDVCDDGNTQEYLQRKKIKIAVHQKWMSRLDPQVGLAAWVCTPWHVDDASHEILGLPGWCTLIHRVSVPLDGTMEQEVVGAGPDYWQVVGAMQAEYEGSRLVQGAA